MKKILLLILLSLTVISAGNSASAENLTVGTIERPPMAYQTDDGWSGFSIDIWNVISTKL